MRLCPVFRDNVVQPDALLRIVESSGGSSRIDEHDFLALRALLAADSAGLVGTIENAVRSPAHADFVRTLGRK